MDYGIRSASHLYFSRPFITTLLLPDLKISLNYGLSISRSALIKRFLVPVHASLCDQYDLMLVHSECVFFLFSCQQPRSCLNVNMFSPACPPQSPLQKAASFSFPSVAVLRNIILLMLFKPVYLTQNLDFKSIQSIIPED